MKCLHFHTISQKSFQWRHPVVLVFFSHRLQMWCFDLFFFFSLPVVFSLNYRNSEFIVTPSKVTEKLHVKYQES